MARMPENFLVEHTYLKLTFYQWLKLMEADLAGQGSIPKAPQQAAKTPTPKITPQAGKPPAPKTTPQASQTPIRTPKVGGTPRATRHASRFYLHLPSFKALDPATQQMVWQNAGRLSQGQLSQLSPEEKERVNQLNMDMIHAYQQSDDDDYYDDGAGRLDDLGVPADTPIPDDWRTANWGKIS